MESSKKRSRVIQCVGDACRVIKEKAPTIVGTATAVGSNLASAGASLMTGNVMGAMQQLGSAASGGNTATYDRKKLERDLSTIDSTLKNADALINRLRRRQYKVCNLGNMQKAVNIVQARINEYRGKGTELQGAVGDFNRSAFADWYRDQLSRDLFLLSTAFTAAMLEAQDKANLLLHYKLARDDNERNAIMKELTESCD